MKNTKKIMQICLIMICVSILMGCARINTTIEVKKNGKADISLLYAVIDTSDSSDEAPGDTIKKLEADGWECTKYTQEGFIGYECTKYNVSLNELVNTLSSAENDVNLNANNISIEKKGFTYTLDWKVFDGDQAEQIRTYKRFFDMSDGFMKFVVKLPYKPKNCNASEISEDGKTLTWDLLTLDEGQTVHVEFSVFNFILFVIILIICVIIAGLVIYFLVYKNRGSYFSTGKKQNAANWNNRNSTVPLHSETNIIQGEINNPSVPMDLDVQTFDTSYESNEQQIKKQNNIDSNINQNTGFVYEEKKESHSQEKSFFCPNCGTKISESALFCYNCGSSINRDESGMISHISSDNNTVDNNTIQTKIYSPTVSKDTSFFGMVTEIFRNKKVIVLSLAAIAILIVLLVVIIKGFYQKMAKKENDINTEVLNDVENADEINNDETEMSQNPMMTVVSRRPIPEKEYQDVLFGGYSMRIPSEAWMYYDNKLSDWAYGNDDYGYMSMLFSLRKRFIDQPEYYVNIESSVLGEGKHYPDEDSFRRLVETYTLVDIKEINNLEIEHYQNLNSDSVDDVYLTINNNEALSIAVSYYNDSVSGMYGDFCNDLINSVLYTEGGVYDQGVLFIKDGELTSNIDWENIDDGAKVLEDIIGTDIYTFLDGMNESVVELNNVIMEKGITDAPIQEDEEVKRKVEKCEEYLQKIRNLHYKLKTPTNYMLGYNYNGELCNSFPDLVLKFANSLSSYCDVGDILSYYGY